MKRCSENTKEMLNILDTFNKKINDLGVVIIPVHEETSNLTKAQKNIDQTITVRTTRPLVSIQLTVLIYSAN